MRRRVGRRLGEALRYALVDGATLGGALRDAAAGGATLGGGGGPVGGWQRRL